MSNPVFIKLKNRTINIAEIASVLYNYPEMGIATITLKQVYMDRDGQECDYVRTDGPGEFQNLKTFFEPDANPRLLTVIDLTAEEQSNVERN